MRRTKYIIISLFILISLPGCEAIKAHFMEVSTHLYKEFSVISGHIGGKAEIAEGKGNTELADKLYSDVDELGEACSSLQESSYKKLFGEILSFGLKIATIGSLPTCEDKVHEMQKRFPDYKGSELRFQLP